MADLTRSVKQPFKAPKVKAVTASATLTPADSGKTITLGGAASTVVTLPKLRSKQQDGMNFTFSLVSLPTGNGHEVRPATGDSIQWAAAGASVVASEALRCAVAADNIGACVEVIADYATTSWVVKNISGTWSKVA